MQCPVLERKSAGQGASWGKQVGGHQRSCTGRTWLAFWDFVCWFGPWGFWIVAAWGLGVGGHRFCFVLTGSHQLTHPILTLPILLSQPHRRWNCRRTPPFLMWPTLWKHSSSFFFPPYTEAQLTLWLNSGPCGGAGPGHPPLPHLKALC